MNITLLVLIILVPILAMILLGLNTLLAPHKAYEDKLSQFECGSPVITGQTRESFQIHFLIVAMLFLVFDIELVLLLPVAVSLHEINSFGFYTALSFFIILVIGFIFEFGSNAISLKQIKSAKNTDNNNDNNHDNNNNYLTSSQIPMEQIKIKSDTNLSNKVVNLKSHFLSSYSNIKKDLALEITRTDLINSLIIKTIFVFIRRAYIIINYIFSINGLKSGFNIIKSWFLNKSFFLISDKLFKWNLPIIGIFTIIFLIIFSIYLNWNLLFKFENLPSWLVINFNWSELYTFLVRVSYKCITLPFEIIWFILLWSFKIAVIIIWIITRIMLKLSIYLADISFNGGFNVEIAWFIILCNFFYVSSVIFMFIKLQGKLFNADNIISYSDYFKIQEYKKLVLFNLIVIFIVSLIQLLFSFILLFPY
jgi:NADH-ubiquinone oxidoreductase chain 3